MWASSGQFSSLSWSTLLYPYWWAWDYYQILFKLTKPSFFHSKRQICSEDWIKPECTKMQFKYLLVYQNMMIPQISWRVKFLLLGGTERPDLGWGARAGNRVVTHGLFSHIKTVFHETKLAKKFMIVLNSVWLWISFQSECSECFLNPGYSFWAENTWFHCFYNISVLVF